MELFFEGLLVALQPINFLWIIIATLAGIILGAIPGLTGAMGITLMIPMTYGMNTVTAICLLLGVYCGGTYGGSITAILINTPGSGASVVTAFDGYELAKQGKGGKALRMALYASFVGGIISALILTTISPAVAAMALKFGPCEYLALIILGLTVVGGVSGDDICKGIIAAALGLLVAMIGQDPGSGTQRLTFGIPNLISGVPSVPLLIGMFALSEILLHAEKVGSTRSKIEIARMEGDQRLTLREFCSYWKTIVKGSLIGTFVGAVPGIGASVASFVSYNEAMRASKTPEEFGHGSMDGIAASESGNNGVTGATLIPLLTLGIPGDVVTGILLGAFMLQGLIPGPMLMSEHPETIYSIFAGLFVVNFVMLALGVLGMKYFPLVSMLPGDLMFSCVFIMCAVGAYATQNTNFMVILMIVFGFLGYVMKKAGLPAGAFLVAYMLGGTFESNLQRSMIILENKMWLIFTKPLADVFLVIAVIFLFYIIKMQKAKKTRAAAKENV